MKLKLEKNQLAAIVVMIAAALLISFGISFPPAAPAPLGTPSIPEPAGIYYRPECNGEHWYTFMVPESWDGLIEMEVLPDENGTYHTNVYSTKDREEGGGLLFSFRFYPEGTDLTVLPMWELGIVETKDGSRYHFVFAQPSDMQFAIDNVDNYMAMQEQSLAIIDTVEFEEGILFTPVAGCGMP